MKLCEIFKKQGGFDMVKRYFRGGALFTAVSEFILLGKDRTALELLRNAAELKIKQKLSKRYKSVLLDLDSKWIEPQHSQSNKIWICWFQGMDNAPGIVKKCYESVKRNMSDREIIVITADNMSDYVDFPDYILEKWKKGYITHTHMTDLLRLELLIRHGGTWLDATVFCSDSKIPEYMLNSDLFFFQTLKPGRDGQANYISSWFISAKTNNKVLMATRDLCYAYWKENNNMWDYFLLHDFFSIVLDYYQDDWKAVIPRDNATPHILLLRLFDQYDEMMLNSILEQTPFHKLTYKFTEESKKKKGTFYSMIFERE